MWREVTFYFPSALDLNVLADVLPTTTKYRNNAARLATTSTTVHFSSFVLTPKRQFLGQQFSSKIISLSRRIDLRECRISFTIFYFFFQFGGPQLPRSSGWGCGYHSAAPGSNSGHINYDFSIYLGNIYKHFLLLNCEKDETRLTHIWLAALIQIPIRIFADFVIIILSKTGTNNERKQMCFQREVSQLLSAPFCATKSKSGRTQLGNLSTEMFS